MSNTTTNTDNNTQTAAALASWDALSAIQPPPSGLDSLQARYWAMMVISMVDAEGGHMPPWITEPMYWAGVPVYGYEGPHDQWRLANPSVRYRTVGSRNRPETAVIRPDDAPVGEVEAWGREVRAAMWEAHRKDTTTTSRTW